MEVSVRVFGDLIRYIPSRKDSLEINIPSSCSVKDLLERLSIPDGEVWMVTVNGQHVKNDYIIHENDEVMIFAPVTGG